MGAHASYLAIAALADRQFDPAGGDILALADGGLSIPNTGVINFTRTGGKRGAIFQRNAFCQALKCQFCCLTLNLCEVGFFQLEAGVTDFCLEGTVIGKQQQAFGVPVQAASGVDVGNVQVVSESGVAIGSGELAEHAKGFVKKKQFSHSVRKRVSDGRILVEQGLLLQSLIESVLPTWLILLFPRTNGHLVKSG